MGSGLAGAMIPLAAPIALAVLTLVAWRYEARAGRAYEATLSPAEKRQFRAFRRLHNGWVSSRVKAIMSRDDTGGFRLGGDFPSIAALRPGSISSIDGRFGYVVAVRSQVVPANPDMWQIINYQVYGARKIPWNPFYVDC
jgi:hypothetical protein